jgi:ABC-type transporter Mla subunit MlaD
VSNENKLISILEGQNEKLQSGLMNIQSNLAESVSINYEALKQFEIIKQDFRTLVEDSQKITTEVANLDNKISGTKDKTDVMAKVIEKVSELLRVIAGISDQTNLLAINAAIEAARAGESGRAFAVVANEVKMLSLQTKKNADDIKNAIEEITEQSSLVGQSMDDSTHFCKEIRAVVETFYDKLDATNQVNQKSINQVTGTNDRIFMSLAKLDHILWKVNTYLSVIKDEEMFKFVDHKNCRLGKWYYQGDGKTNFSHLPSYKRVEAPHAVVHTNTKNIFELFPVNDEDFEKLSTSLKEMEKGSEGVFDMLDKILEEKKSSY